uniref:Uncharacterized protein n=1 Tax=Manihot esculenta TaxID=3983 RepID=A0A2C9UGC2_MANES
MPNRDERTGTNPSFGLKGVHQWRTQRNWHTCNIIIASIIHWGVI